MREKVYSTLDVSDDAVIFAQEMARVGMGDGLPLVPPTSERVDEMLRSTSRPPDEHLGWMPPAWGAVTPFHIAVNAVLAGCIPAHLPIVLAAVEAMLEPAFNLHGVQVTTNPVAPLVIVHGPIARSVGINARAGALGPGTFANAVIGRAVRLVLMNVGGGVPAGLDRATQGQPAKYTFCAGENDADSPWPPFSTRRGLPLEASAVTVFAVQAHHNINPSSVQSAEELLAILAAGMGVAATNNITYGGEAIVALPPDNARILSGAGFDPVSVARFLYEHARVDATALPDAVSIQIRQRRPRWIDLRRVPVTNDAADVHLLVIGGAGGHSQFLPSFGPTRAVTRPVGE